MGIDRPRAVTQAVLKGICFTLGSRNHVCYSDTLAKCLRSFPYSDILSCWGVLCPLCLEMAVTVAPSASAWFTLLTSSFEAQLRSLPQEGALGLFSGRGPPLCDPACPETTYMESGQRTKHLPLCCVEGRAGLSPEPALPRAGMIPVPFCSPFLPPSTIWPKVCPRKHWPMLLPPSCEVASPLDRAPKYKAVYPERGSSALGRADLRSLRQTRRLLSGCVSAFLSIIDVEPEMEPVI